MRGLAVALSLALATRALAAEYYWTDPRASSERGRQAVVRDAWLSLIACGIVSGHIASEYGPRDILSNDFADHKLEGEPYVPTYARVGCNDDRAQGADATTDESQDVDACYFAQYVRASWSGDLLGTETVLMYETIDGPSASAHRYTKEQFIRKYGLDPPSPTSDAADDVPGVIEGLLNAPDHGLITVESIDGQTASYSQKFCRRSITVTAALFERGNYDMDPEGKVLSHDRFRHPPTSDPHRLHYRHAVSLKEAVQFVLLHEYAHLWGMTTEGTAEEYARSMILELRKAALGLPHKYRDFGKTTGVFRCDPTRAGKVTLRYVGTPPSRTDLPPGTSAK